MKRKIIAIALIALLINIGATAIINASNIEKNDIKENKKCQICISKTGTARPFCMYLGMCYSISEFMLDFHETNDNAVKATYWRLQKGEIIAWMIAFNCPNRPLSN